MLLPLVRFMSFLGNYERGLSKKVDGQIKNSRFNGIRTNIISDAFRFIIRRLDSFLSFIQKKVLLVKYWSPPVFYSKRCCPLAPSILNPLISNASILFYYQEWNPVDLKYNATDNRFTDFIFERISRRNWFLIFIAYFYFFL